MENAMQAVNTLALEVAGLGREDRAEIMQIAVRELRPLLADLTDGERYQIIKRMAEIIG